jgi:hypothetical protein
MPYIQDAVKRNRVEALCSALESGTYQQGKSALRTTRMTSADQFCCLGVACEIHIKMAAYEGYSGYGVPLITWGNERAEHPSVYQNDATHRQISSTVMPREVIEWYGFEPSHGPFSPETLTGDIKIAEVTWYDETQGFDIHYDSATGANDVGISFPRIAQAIREEYLTAPVTADE